MANYVTRLCPECKEIAVAINLEAHRQYPVEDRSNAIRGYDLGDPEDFEKHRADEWLYIVVVRCHRHPDLWSGRILLTRRLISRDEYVSLMNEFERAKNDHLEICHL